MVDRTADDDGVASLLADLGPTWIAGAIAAGPATMASLLTAGASFGYRLLWVVVLSAGLGALAQYLAARLGLLTERGIVAVVTEQLGDAWAWLLVVDVVVAAGLAQLVIMKTVAGVSATVTGTGPVTVGVTLTGPQVWGLVWAVVLAVGLAGGGYRFLEWGAKLVVSAVVIAFVGSLFVVPVDLAAAATGLVPTVPAGVDGALIAAGILGGAVHVTLVTMQSYTMRSRGWTTDDARLARLDVISSMLVAFGIYSLAIFLVAASVLDSPDLTAIGAANALVPVAGRNAELLFLMGLWGAAVSTLGGNTVVPPFLVADKLGWGTDTGDDRYRALLAATALLSGAGAFVGGAFLPLLVLVLAFGLVGTPFALALVLYLLNDPTVVPERAPGWANAGGAALIAVTAILAANYVRRQLPSSVAGLADPVTLLVVVFAVVLGTGTLLLLARWLREVLARRNIARSAEA